MDNEYVHVTVDTLNRPALDWALEYALSGVRPVLRRNPYGTGYQQLWKSYTTSWTFTGPLIDLFDVELRRLPLRMPDTGLRWQALINGGWAETGETRLVAASRAILAAKMHSRDIEVPSVLLAEAPVRA